MGVEGCFKAGKFCPVRFIWSIAAARRRNRPDPTSDVGSFPLFGSNKTLDYPLWSTLQLEEVDPT